MLSDDDSTRNWGCSVCKGEEFAEGDMLRKARNCDAENSDNLAWEWMPELRRCPWSQLDTAAYEVFRWWVDWTSLKILPWPGTLLEQPAFVYEVIKLCEQWKSEVQVARDKKRQKELERQHKKR